MTRPGGRIGVITRAVDLPRLVNLPLPAQLKAKLEAPGFGGVDARRCAALASAREDGTLLVALPFHGAVGTKT